MNPPFFEKGQEEGYEVWEISTHSQWLRVVPELGASIRTYRWAGISFFHGEKEPILEAVTKAYRNAKLSPIPNRTKHGEYTFEGKTYKMPQNFPYGPHQIHGFMEARPFKWWRSGQYDGCTVSYFAFRYDYQGDYEGFPFPFRISVKYELGDKGDPGFTCTTTVKNTGKTNMPYGDGWHPYFQIDSARIDELELQMPPCQRVLADDSQIATGELAPYAEFEQRKPIGQTQLDDCFLLSPDEGHARIKLWNPYEQIGIEVWQEAQAGQYAYTQIFTPEDRQSIAIEPVTCPSNALNNGMGLQTLAPGQSWSAAWGIRGIRD